ncbi:MAG: hypothetical protein WCO38_09505 [Verrucomicrobiota bacterium]
MAITVKHTKVSTVPDGDDTSVVRPSDWNDDHALTGLGTMAEQNANAVAITGGTISGVTLPASNITGTLDVGHGGTGATTLTGYVKGTGTAALTASSTIPNTDITGLGTASTKDAGVANGVATLDSGGQVPLSQLPPLGDLNYQGTWNATTNTPTLTSSVGTKGYYYVVSVAGTTNLNGITDWQIGDWAVFNGSVWQKIDNTDAVTSVNGYTGTVVLTAADVSAVPYTGATGAVDLNAKTLVNVSNLGVNTTTVPTIKIRAVGDNNSSSRIAMRGYSSDANSSAIRVSKFRGTVAAPQAPISGDSLGKFELAGYGTTSADAYPQVSLEGVTTEVWGATSRGAKAVVKVTPNTTITQVTALTIDQDSKATFASTVTANGVLLTGNTGTVTSVAATAGTGISVSGSPITTSGTLTITNTAPDQTVALTAGTGISTSGTYPNFTITNTAPSSGGTVTSVTGTAPIVSSGGNTPAISIPAATTSVNGYLTSTDWNTFNGKQPAGTYVNSVSGTTGRITSTGGTTPVIDLASGVATAGTTGSSTLIPVVTIDTYGRVTGITTAANPQGTVTSVTGTAPVVSSGGNTPAISMAAATGSVNGYLTSTDWTTFNNKSNTNGTVTSVAALTLGTTGTDLSSTVANGTTTPVITLQVPTASAANRGALSAADWTTFNNKTSNTGTVTSVGGTGTVNGLTLTGTVTTSGSLTLGGTLDLSAPPAIGATTPSTGAFTTLTNSGLTTGRVTYATTGGLLTDSANLTFNGTTLTTANDASISGLKVGKGSGSVSTNTALGLQAINSNSTGAYNTAIGYQAYSGGTSDLNTAVGYQAVYGSGANTYNTGVGAQAIRNVTSGSYNSALGVNALITNLTGSYNVAVGVQALQANTASNSTAVGYQAGYSTTSGGIDALGYQAGYTNSIGANLVAIGTYALRYNTSGTNNSAVGVQALQGNTTASSNTGMGYQAGLSNQTGAENAFFGAGSGQNTTGSDNAFIGAYAGRLTTSGAYNTALGATALYSNTTASYNTAVGYQAGYTQSGASTGNSYYGYQSGYGVTTGTYNVILGSYQGSAAPISATGSNFVVLSDGQGNIVASTKTAQTFALQGGTLSAGTGIAFPATQSASTDANTLDDYEEGTWTPTQGGNLTVVGTFSSSGTYTKIGRMVVARGQVLGSTSVAFTGGAPAILAGSLPFSAAGGPVVGNAVDNNFNQGIVCFVSGTNIYGSSAITATAAISFGVTYFV